MGSLAEDPWLRSGAPSLRALESRAGWARWNLASVLGAEELPGGDTGTRGHKDGLPLHTDALYPPPLHLPGHPVVLSAHCWATHTTSPSAGAQPPLFSPIPCLLSHTAVQPALCTQGTAQAPAGQACRPVQKDQGRAFLPESQLACHVTAQPCSSCLGTLPSLFSAVWATGN